MKRRSKSYFALRREECLRERLKRAHWSSSHFSSVSSQVPGTSRTLEKSGNRGQESYGGDLEDDIWSFGGVAASYRINLEEESKSKRSRVPSPAPREIDPELDNTIERLTQEESQFQLDPELEALIVPESTRRLQKYIKEDKQGVQGKALGKIGNRLRRKSKEKETPLPPPPPVYYDDEEGLIGWATPVEGDEEVNRLEESITVENSPLRPFRKKPKRFRRFVTPSPTKSQLPTPFSPQIQFSQRSDHFSSQISQVPSTPPSRSSPVSRTPLSEWIHQDTSTVVPPPIPQFPPSTPPILPPPPAISLLQDFSAIKARYDSSVRLLGHDLRNAKFPDTDALHLLIKTVVDHHDKLVHTLAYDLKEDRHRWVIWKPVDPTDIKEGVVLKVYPPWQTVQILGGTSVIIGTDFYRVAVPSSLHVSEERIQEIMALPGPVASDTKFREPVFMDMVPFHLKNRQTLGYHLNRCHSRLDLDVVILQSWSHLSPALFLLQDASDVLSFLEIPRPPEKEKPEDPDPPEELAIQQLQNSKMVSLKGLIVAEKVPISKKLAPFSVLYLFAGARQKHFYTLRWIPSWSTVENLDAPFVGMESTAKQVLIDGVHQAPPNQDHRISLKCRVKTLDKDHLLVTDDDGDKSLRIEVIPDPVYKLREGIGVKEGVSLVVKFLRVIYGKAIWDSYTIYEELGPGEKSEESFAESEN